MHALFLPKRCPSANMMEAPICTVGPSRPIEAPQPSPSSVSSDLAHCDAQRQHGADPRRILHFLSPRSPAECRCPARPETPCGSADTDSASPTGVMMSARYGLTPVAPVKQPHPRAWRPSANTTAVTLIASAPAQNATRGTQALRDSHCACAWRKR